MKTIKSIFALFTITFLFAGVAFATEFNFEEEDYINDIPFSTACVSAECIYEKAIAEEYQFEEETFVEDIPFNTQKVTANNNFLDATSSLFEFEEEAFINDIPFDTYAVKTTHSCNQYAYKH